MTGAAAAQMSPSAGKMHDSASRNNNNIMPVVKELNPISPKGSNLVAKYQKKLMMADGGGGGGGSFRGGSFLGQI